MTEHWLDRLPDEDRTFIKRFVLASGSLKALAEIYGISYPTVRLRLDRLIEKIRVLDSQEILSEFERTLRARHADGKIDAETLRELLGPHVPEDAVRDTCISIGSQILYYSYAWPVFSKVFPDHPGMAQYHRTLAQHIIRFSLGGIAAIKNHYQT